MTSNKAKKKNEKLQYYPKVKDGRKHPDVSLHKQNHNLICETNVSCSLPKRLGSG